MANTKLVLANGYEVEIGPAPLGKRGDALWEKLAALNAEPDLQKNRKLAVEVGLVAIGMFSPGIKPEDAADGLDAANIKRIVRILNADE